MLQVKVAHQQRSFTCSPEVATSEDRSVVIVPGAVTDLHTYVPAALEPSQAEAELAHCRVTGSLDAAQLGWADGTERAEQSRRVLRVLSSTYLNLGMTEVEGSPMPRKPQMASGAPVSLLRLPLPSQGFWASKSSHGSKDATWSRWSQGAPAERPHPLCPLAQCTSWVHTSLKWSPGFPGPEHESSLGRRLEDAELPGGDGEGEGLQAAGVMAE